MSNWGAFNFREAGALMKNGEKCIIITSTDGNIFHRVELREVFDYE